MLDAFITPFSLGFLTTTGRASVFIHGVLSLTVGLNSISLYKDQPFVKKENLNIQKITATKINKAIITNYIKNNLININL